MNAYDQTTLLCLAEGSAPPDVHRGVVVVAALDPKDAKVLALKGGLPWKELHCTVAFLGDLSELGDDAIPKLKKALTNWVQGRAPIPALVGGIGRFPGSKEEGDPVYLPVDAPRLTIERPSLLAALREAGAPAKTNHGFSAHITLSYIPRDAELPTQRVKARQIRFRAFELWAGTDHSRYPLTADYDTPEPSLRDAPKLETAMRPDTLAEMSLLAAGCELPEAEDHQGEKMVFGVWRKVPVTASDHASEAEAHAAASRSHEKAGIEHARKAGAALHARNDKGDSAAEGAYKHHEAQAASHFALHHAHEAASKGHQKVAQAAKAAGVPAGSPVAPHMARMGVADPNPTAQFGGIHHDGTVHTPENRKDAATHAVHGRKGRELASSYLHTALAHHRQGRDPAAGDKHHPYLDQTPAAPDFHESRLSPSTSKLMEALAAGAPA